MKHPFAPGGKPRGAGGGGGEQCPSYKSGVRGAGQSRPT